MTSAFNSAFIDIRLRHFAKLKRMRAKLHTALDYRCSICGAIPGTQCASANGCIVPTHESRIARTNAREK